MNTIPCGAVFAALLASAITAAQETPARGDLYRVELVLIVHRDAAAAGAVPAADATVTPRQARPLPPVDPTRPERLPRRLPPNELKLLGLVEARRPALAEHSPLGAVGWRLGARALRAGRTVRLDGELPGLLGFVRVRLGTRLVVELDLRWAPEAANDPPWQVFRLRERRVVRLNELHYFDHPAFAVLLRIERDQRSLLAEEERSTGAR